MKPLDVIKPEECVFDPLNYVLRAFPWGEENTWLESEEGPDKWQRQVLRDIGDALKGAGSSGRSVRVAIKSGHGVGKTAFAAFLIKWWESTRPHNQQVTTANTKVQLETKTWRELAKWNNVAIDGGLFEHTATQFRYKRHPKTWAANAIPWSVHKPEAFAGTHEKHVFILFDEASAIDDAIWETAEGAMTTPGALWVVMGNPTRNTGRFAECFGKHRALWKTYTVDASQSQRANQEEVAGWVDAYGADSDFVRVRVKGEFPRASSLQFIPVDVVEAAMKREYPAADYGHAPKILGVDVARFGADLTVFCKRQGLHVYPLSKHAGLSTMTCASLVNQIIDQWQPDAVFIDAVGIGAGVYDRLIQLGRHRVYAVNVGERADEEKKYANKRMEIWARVKEWLPLADLPEDRDLRDDLIGPEYGFDMKERMQLERKEDMAKRGLSSPDCGDALALTFTQKVVRASASPGFRGAQTRTVNRLPGKRR